MRGLCLSVLVASGFLSACVAGGGPAGLADQSPEQIEPSGRTDLDPEQVQAGQRIAERECASCHSIDRTSISPNRSAPPLREVLAMNDSEFLAYRFIEAMRITHDKMPLFDFDVRSADALIAYIQSINTTRN